LFFVDLEPAKNNKEIHNMEETVETLSYKCNVSGSIPERTKIFHVVGPCHHGMARPQVVDRGTASDKEGSCEYTE